MPFVIRNGDGRIVALFAMPSDEAREEVGVDDADVTEFLHGGAARDTPCESLASSDMAMVRIIEDVIDLLIEKHTILFTELPSPAQEKLLRRRKLRVGIHDLSGLATDKNLF